MQPTCHPRKNQDAIRSCDLAARRTDELRWGMPVFAKETRGFRAAAEGRRIISIITVEPESALRSLQTVQPEFLSSALTHKLLLNHCPDRPTP